MFDANLSSTRQRFSENGTTPQPVAGTWQTVNQGTLNVGYELDFWGKNRSAVEAALGRLKAMEVDRYATQLMLSSAIVQAYIELEQGYEQLAIEQKMLKQQEEILLTHAPALRGRAGLQDRHQAGTGIHSRHSRQDRRIGRIHGTEPEQACGIARQRAGPRTRDRPNPSSSAPTQ